MESVFIKTDYITLGQFLKFTGIITNGGEAKNLLEEGLILVNNKVEMARGKKLFPGDSVIFDGEEYKIEA
jgi:ribosome-associated protein